MIKAIASFEVRYHLRAPLFYILLLVYFLLTFGAVASDAVTIGGAIGNVNRNAPFVIMQILLIMSIFGVLTTTAFVANSVHRDFELGTDSLFFSSPIGKTSYLGGRFLGSFAVSVLVYLGVTGAIVIGSLMPWVEKERLGPFELWPYLFSMVVMVAPNLLLAGAIFFAVAALTRSLMATYSAVVAFFVAFGVAESLLEDIENEWVAGLLDPFGIGAFALSTRYWTVFQKNTEVIPLEGIFLWNRLLWIAVALAVLAFAFWRFEFTTGTRRNRGKAPRAEEEIIPTAAAAAAVPAAVQTFGGAAAFRQFLARVRLEAAMVFKSIPFAIMLMLGVLNIWGNTVGSENLFGTPVYPVTGLMVETIYGAFSIFALLMAAFFAGEIVWRERVLKLDEVSDAMPLPVWAQWTSKFIALLLVLYTTLLAAILTSMVIQTARGYTNYELDVYFKGVILQIGTFLMLVTALAFILQVLFNQKFVGFLGVMVFFVASRALPALDFEHRLYRFASVPPWTYSDMNGYGHFARPLLAFNTYWALLVAALLAVSHLLWVRGTDGGLRQRLAIARGRLRAPAALALGLFLAGFAALGGYIYYNTNVLNSYRTTRQREALQAEVEKKYKKFEGIAQPRITSVQADVDIFPERREVRIRGSYVLANRTGVPLRELHVSHAPDTLTTFNVEIPGARLKSDDRLLGYAIYELAQPLAPGATMPMRFESGFAAKGFVNGESNTNVVENGTFFNSIFYFPHLGYNEGVEVQDRNDRRRNGLAPVQRMKPPTDTKARMNNQIARDADWISLDTTVSTSADQVALAPGYLQKEWSANGRRYFHYRTTSPILSFWSYLSARYEVKRDSWKGVPIEIYYDAAHRYNVDRMIHSVKKSLDYFTVNFSPYQHRQVRILEFPRYERFAQSFPNTIPFSESIGFIADLRDDDHLDYVFYVTAHEVAHQWWAHQVIGGNVKGSTMIVETMAQYSALMVMEKEYGRDRMQRFLRYELDRYLSGRGGELVAEAPLALVEDQGYIHYRKGSLAMYALRDAVGEERVNRALARFLRDYAFSGPPYTTAQELVRYLRAETPEEYQELVTDLFERITLYDNQAREVTASKRADGAWDVTMTVASTKFRGDEKGAEEPVPVDDWMDIGVLGEKDKVLFSERRRIDKPVQTFRVVVKEKPVKAGIDPFNKLIDRNPKDNVKSL